MPYKSGNKWKWGNIERSDKEELRRTVYGIWKKNGSKGSFSKFWKTGKVDEKAIDMKHTMKNNQKITLTLKQLKKLVRESAKPKNTAQNDPSYIGTFNRVEDVIDAIDWGTIYNYADSFFDYAAYGLDRKDGGKRKHSDSYYARWAEKYIDEEFGGIENIDKEELRMFFDWNGFIPTLLEDGIIRRDGNDYFWNEDY